MGPRELHGKTPFKAELCSTFFRSAGTNSKIYSSIYVNHLYLCCLVNKGPECTALLKCPEVLIRGPSFFLQVRSVQFDKLLIKKEKEKKNPNQTNKTPPNQKPIKLNPPSPPPDMVLNFSNKFATTGGE